MQMRVEKLQVARNFDIEVGAVPRRDEIDLAALTALMSNIDYTASDEKRLFAPHLINQLRSLGIFSLSAPAQYGGRALDLASIARIVRHLAYYDLSTAVLVALHNMLAAPALYHHRPSCLTDEAIRRVASGDDLVAYGLTEMLAGSDPRRISASARFDVDGKTVKLNGQKCWTGLGAWSRYTVFFAQAYDPTGVSRGMTAFLINTDADRPQYLGEHLTLGLRAIIQNSFRVTDLRVDADRTMGSIGGGLVIAKDRMANSRIAVAAMASGALARCLEIVTRFAEGRSIGTGKLRDSLTWTSIMAMAKLCFLSCDSVVAEALTAGEKFPEDADLYFTIAKVLNSAIGFHGINLCLQGFGGRGFDETFEVARFFRDSRVLSIFEGSNGSLAYFIGRSVLSKFRDGTIDKFVSAFGTSDSLLKGIDRSKLCSVSGIDKQRLVANLASNTMHLFLQSALLRRTPEIADFPAAINSLNTVVNQQIFDDASDRDVRAGVLAADAFIREGMQFFGNTDHRTMPLNFCWS
ncbi:acyl-CoA dehydrogenase family protein [Ensifer adhaerens]|uniref:acyl-CoA dehydrogenase family protein n=1 Tax=Ensifer adhaerens TaxID=106592 RepID=UPI00384FCD64